MAMAAARALDRARQMSLVAGGMFLTGGIVSGAISRVPYEAPGFYAEAQLALAVLTFCVGVGLLLTTGKIPPPLFHPILIVGLGVISFGSWLSGDLSASNAMFYAWGGAFVYTFFTWRQALAYTAYAGAGYVLVLANLHDNRAPVGRWIYAVSTMIVTGAVIRWLVAQLERARDEVADLNEHLEARVAEQVGEIERYAVDLRDSRQRLVTSQDTERRRLERDLHDGAQQQIVALKIRLNLVRAMLSDGDVEDAEQLVREVMTDVDDAVRSLRELAHGIYPPLLASDGLARALAARTARSEVPIDVVDEGVGRCLPEVEATVYFCCLEAIQNITKYARASAVSVTLARTSDGLEFRVSDDGVGFDATTVARGHGLNNLQDRLDALAGSLVVESTPGVGTTIHGTIPLAAEVLAAT